MKNYRSSEKVNAGSMADIAFLLLIFFLVTTTIAIDSGINRNLPKECPVGIDCAKTIHERNILRIELNKENDILVKEKLMTLSDIKELVIEHINNNGDKTCSYCDGNSTPTLSDNPNKAVISIQHHRDTNYELYVSIQDEISKAYNDLKVDYAKKIYQKPLLKLTSYELNHLNKLYPIKISEVVAKN